ncbi:MAG: dockerin type I domain-containing protein [Verrucomicrobiota bacterium]|nr:dockerin type I domain-containing protein [Verrucomicrobiota bacterium]
MKDVFSSSPARWTLTSVLVLAAFLCVIAVFKTGAANPTAGTISTTSAPLAWDGTAAGGVSATGEMTCVDGVNCDTFTLTVQGTPTDWAGKSIEVVISWVVLASDFDLYVHKTSNSGPLIGSSTGGAPGTTEKVTISPASLNASGTTVFTVHVVYSAAVAGDQYHGTATVISTGPGATPTPTPPPKSTAWTIKYHGQCCEGNLAAAGSNTFVLLPVLVQGNKIEKSSDGGKTWTEKYPPVGASVPFGIEGDMQAYKNDVIFFGTELGDVVTAHSEDFGDTFSITHVPIASAGNDQAWSYLGPLKNMRPQTGAIAGDEDYVMAGWMRIGSALIFSFDGGLTYPIQTPLVGNDGSGPEHIVCQQNAHTPIANPPADTRVANADFTKKKAGRHGTFGTDRKFYWTETTPDSLYVCSTADFGLNWAGVKHPLAAYPGSDFVVTHSAFDDKGTLYVLHGNRLYVSFNRGESFAYVHTLPRYGNALRSDKGADQYFVASCGTAHLALIEDAGEGRGRIYYLRGTNVDTATPTWDEELVDETDSVRLDFMYIVVNGNGIPTISYTTPGTGKQVTTASRNAPLPGGNVCAFSRKNHTVNGPSDIELPMSNAARTECRSSGPTGDYQIIFNFPTAVTVGGASVSSGSGTVSSSNVDGSVVTVNLTGVNSPQLTTVTLSDVNDGASIRTVSVQMPVLVGDVNGDSTVNAADATVTRNLSGQKAGVDNFRADVNSDGTIDSADATLVRNRSGQQLTTSSAAKLGRTKSSATEPETTR